MSNVRLVPAKIELAYEMIAENEDPFLQEFDEIGGSEDDPIGLWLRQGRARAETDEGSVMMVTLMAELYRKMEKIEQILTHGSLKRLSLSSQALIDSIGLEYFKLDSENLEEGRHYYGRVEISTFPKREIALFFEAVEPSLAKITKIRTRDKEEWGYYMTARERAMIRQLKGFE